MSPRAHARRDVADFRPVERPQRRGNGDDDGLVGIEAPHPPRGPLQHADDRVDGAVHREGRADDALDARLTHGRGDLCADHSEIPAAVEVRYVPAGNDLQLVEIGQSGGGSDDRHVPDGLAGEGSLPV